MHTLLHINTKKPFNVFHSMSAHKYTYEEQHKMVSTKILSNLCLNINVYVIVNYEK